MTTHKEVLMLAIEALEDYGHAWPNHVVQYTNAITAIKKALAQPEHEKYCPICQGVGQVDTGIMESPVTICNACNGTGLKAQPELCKYGQEPKSCTSSPMDCQCAIDATFAQPEQEPDYAWPTIEDYENDVGFTVGDAFKIGWSMARTTNDLFTQMVKQS